MKIGILADIHLGPDNEEEVKSELRSVVDRFNSGSNPEEVVVLGDMIEDNDVATDIDSLSSVSDVLSDLDSNVTYLFGNHDVMNLSHNQLLETLDQESAWGTVGGDEFIYLDTSAPELHDPRGQVSTEQLNFLEEKLDAVDQAVVFAHHPLHYQSLEDNDWFREHPELAFCGNKGDVHDVIDKTGTETVVVSGHLHETGHWRHEDTDHFSVGPFNKESPGTGVAGIFADIEVGPRIEIRIVAPDMTQQYSLTLPD